MPFESRRGRKLRALWLALALACAACAHKPPASTPVVVASSPAGQPDPVIALLNYAGELARGTSEQREQAVDAARRAVADAPGAMNYAQLALAYGAPAQRRYTPDEVPRYAHLALQAMDADWSDAARQYLRDYARLYAALDRKQSSEARDSSQSSKSTGAESSQSHVEDEQRIAELQSQLADARRKLRELANIEENLSTNTR